MENLYATYLDRIARLRRNPPGAHWDGVFQQLISLDPKYPTDSRGSLILLQPEFLVSDSGIRNTLTPVTARA